MYPVKWLRRPIPRMNESLGWISTHFFAVITRIYFLLNCFVYVRKPYMYPTESMLDLVR